MKLSRLLVLVEIKNGSIYQVALTDEEKATVTNLLQQLHNGEIKIHREKMPIEFEKRSKMP